MELTLKSSAKFRNSVVIDEKSQEGINETLCGISRNGRFCWVASGSRIEVRSVATGNKVSGYNFQNTLRSLTLIITCVAEIDIPEVDIVVLAIGFETSAFDGVICLYSVQGSRPLQMISIDDGVTSCTYVRICNLSNILATFDGCLAVGTVSGRLVLINMNLKMFRSSLFACNQHLLCHIEPTPCTIIPAASSPGTLERMLQKTSRENVFFGIDLTSVQNPSTIVSIMDLPELVMLATGCLDGCLVLYNLQEMEGIHKAYPPKSDCPLIKLAFMTPADDPRGHVYIWALHKRLPIAVMHLVTIEERTDDVTSTVNKYFKSSRPCLTMPNYSEPLIPIGSQSFSRQLTPEDPMSSICMLSWGAQKGGGKILMFDLNQWYKEQMPDYSEWDKVSYLAVFPLTGETLKNVWLDENSITAFNSIQRPEEHFYPNSLTFDCVCVTMSGSDRYQWEGLQNRALENFRACGAKAILEPEHCFKEMLDAVLLPQFSNFKHSDTSSLSARRDLLLAIALEYNCAGILRECAKVWADGSHLGHHPFEGLSLSTLTEWILQRFTVIRECCDNLCEPLFSGRPSDTQSTKTLAQCAQQMKLLAELMEMIINFCHEYIPQDVQEILTDQFKEMQVSAEYHEVLLWLLNMGLLPVGSWCSSSFEDAVIPYPYPILKTFYDKKRLQFHTLIWKQRNYHIGECSCSLLYIDTFIERECGGSMLCNKWRKSGGSGLYPPASLHAMINIFLLSEIPTENKYALFMYLLLDLDMTMKSQEKYAGIIGNLIKFPAVFKMNTSVIKTTQAFWKLDHGDLEGALEDLVSPLGQDKHLAQWQMELLIECLLVHDNVYFALRALQAPGPPISSLLEMHTLLSNKLVCEAFQLQKSRGDPSLLREFFKMCWEMKLFGKILNLALTEADGEILGEFLRNIDSVVARNMQFCYLLQRSKYMEALALVAKLQKRHIADTDTLCMVMDAYNSTMTPTVRGMSQLFFHRHKQHESAEPVPLSSRLINEKRCLKGGMYEKSASAVEDATMSWLFQSKSTNELTSAPFLRKPIQEFLLKPETMIIHPTVINGSQKRKIDGDSPVSAEDMGGIKKKFRPDEPSRHLTTFPQKSKANQFESDIQKHISKLQETFKIQQKLPLSETSFKFFQVEALETTSSPESETDLINVSSRSTSFLGVTPRPSIHKATQSRNSSMNEIFSPYTSRVQSRCFDSPKARRSLRSLSPQTQNTEEQEVVDIFVSENKMEMQNSPAQLEDTVQDEEEIKVSESDPAAAVEICIPEIVVTCEDDEEDQRECVVPEVASEEVSIEDEEVSDNDETGSEDVQLPPKRLILNPAVKFVQKMSGVSQEDNLGSEEEVEEEESDEEVEEESENEDENESEDSTSDEEAEGVGERYKFFLEDDGQLKSTHEPEQEGGKEKEKRIPTRKPLVSDEVIDILDSSEDEERHFEQKVRHVEWKAESLKSADIQSEELYGNLEIDDGDKASKDALNDALLFESPSVSQGEPMDSSGQDEHNEAVLMTTVFSHGEEAFDVRQVDQGDLMDTVFSPADLEPIEEEPSIEALNTGALITTVFPNEMSGSIFHADTPYVAEESTLNEMERGLIYNDDDDEDISFKSCEHAESITVEETVGHKPEISPDASKVAQYSTVKVVKLDEEPKEAEDLQVRSSASVQEEKDISGAFDKCPEILEEMEVVEVIPAPKIAYQTTEQSQVEDRPLEITEYVFIKQEECTIVKETTIQTPKESTADHQERQVVVEKIPPPDITYQMTVDNSPVEIICGTVEKATQEDCRALEVTSEDSSRQKNGKSKLETAQVFHKDSRDLKDEKKVTEAKVPNASSSQQVGKLASCAVQDTLKSMKPTEKDKQITSEEKQAVSENLQIQVGGKGRKNKSNTASTSKSRKRSSSTEERQLIETKRTTRAASVPKMSSIPEENHQTESYFRDIFQDNPRTTRKRSRDLNVPEIENALKSSPKKRSRSRLGSTSSVDTQDSSVPSKNLRSRKQSTDEEPKLNIVTRRNTRGLSRAPTEPDILEDDTERGIQDYSQTRRLTRSQVAVLEKLSKAKPAPSSKKRFRIGKAVDPDDDTGSDQESVQSEKSTPESIRSRGSRASKSSRGKRAVSVESSKSSVSTRSRGNKATKEPTDDASVRSLRKKK